MARQKHGITPEGEEKVRATYTRWLADGTTWIGMFENHDLGHRDVGHRISLAFDDSQFDAGIVGTTRAPDRQDIGLGWRYILIAKLRTVDEAVTWLKHEEAVTRA